MMSNSWKFECQNIHILWTYVYGYFEDEINIFGKKVSEAQIL